jgi:single-strand DNA-binding protein
MYNRIMAIGNLGRDPEMRYTAQGIAMTTFSMATNRVYTDSGGDRQEETQWFTVVTWRQLAEQCNQYLVKGRRAFVEGRLRSRTWEGNDGRPHFVVEIIADQVRFLDRPDRGGESGTAPEPGAADVPPLDPDDLPF